MEPLVAVILFATPIGLIGVGIAHLHRRRRKHRKPLKHHRKPSEAEENLLK